MSPPLCPFCGACSPRQCELEEETGGICPWDEILEDDDAAEDEAEDDLDEDEEW